MVLNKGIAVFLFMVSAALAFAGGKAEQGTASSSEHGGVSVEFPSVLVEADWVVDRLDSENLVILDSGRELEDYREAHLPGALYAKAEGYRKTINSITNMFPGVDETVSWLQELGISNDTAVLVYDSGNSLWASRVAWTLAYLGHTNWAVLNGGLAVWESNDYPVQKGILEASGRGSFTPNVQQQMLVSGDQVLEGLGSSQQVVVDARSPGEFSGTDVRANRGGHIPGAVLVEWTENQTGGDFPLMLGPDELAEFYFSENITRDKNIVTHCQTGIRGAVSWLALTLAGYENVALYDGSWLEWANDDKYPVEN